MRERQFFERLGATFGSPSSGISAEWLVNAERDGINLLTQEEDWLPYLADSFDIWRGRKPR
jgi:hypothetical protein